VTKRANTAAGRRQFYVINTADIGKKYLQINNLINFTGLAQRLLTPYHGRNAVVHNRKF
jgi:hypothetical protein